MSENLTKFLKNARISAGLKQQEVGKKLGYKANTISNWESGRTEPGIDTLIKLCRLYNVSFIDLLNYIDEHRSENPAPTIKELEKIHKYRKLDIRGKENVDAILEREYLYCQQTLTTS